ncbi:hypothetical protein ABK040_001765 [Willaertia magna]
MHKRNKNYNNRGNNNNNYIGYRGPPTKKNKNVEDNTSSNSGGGGRNNQHNNPFLNKKAPPPLDIYKEKEIILINDEKAPKRNNIDIWNFNDFEDDMIIIKESEQQPTHLSAKLASLLEFKRFCLIKELRNYLDKLCTTETLFYDNKPFLLDDRNNQKVGAAPSESFNRWLYEQLSTPKSKITEDDPLLKRPEVAFESKVLSEEIYSEIPFRLRSRTVKQGVQSLYTYYNNGMKWLERMNKEEEIKNICENILRELKSLKHWLDNNYHYNDLLLVEEKVKYIKENCSNLFHSIVSKYVNSICERLSKKAKEKIKELNQLEDNLDNLTVTLNYDESDALCLVHYKNNNEEDLFKLNLIHHNKLRLLYRKHNLEKDPNLNDFPYRLYSLVRRYQTFFGDLDKEEGANFHAALPEKGFNFLRKQWKVTQECFASPFNCFFKTFCSAFIDTDRYFGSYGSFFDFKPIQGSFECGPPYTLEVMNKTAEYCLELLASTDKPLSFIVFVPEWTDTEYGRLLHPDNTNYCKGHFLADSSKHEYVIGLQHLKENIGRYWTLPFPTHVYFLQNEMGSKTWPVNDTLIEQFKKVMEL